jgi:hypothetical protein
LNSSSGRAPDGFATHACRLGFFHRAASGALGANAKVSEILDEVYRNNEPAMVIAPLPARLIERGWPAPARHPGIEMQGFHINLAGRISQVPKQTSSFSEHMISALKLDGGRVDLAEAGIGGERTSFHPMDQHRCARCEAALRRGAFDGKKTRKTNLRVRFGCRPRRLSARRRLRLP